MQQLSDLLLGVSADLDDLEETIIVVEKQRNRFRIDDAELESRRGFIRSMRTLVDSVYRSVDLTPAQRAASDCGCGSVRSGAEGGKHIPSIASVADDSPPNTSRGDMERVGLLGGGNLSVGEANGTSAHEKSSIVEGAQQMQQIQITQQNDLLEGLSSVVGRLNQVGKEMKHELDTQDAMLGSLGDQVQGAGAAMVKLKGKMAEMAKSKDRGKYCAILVLSVILMLLITMAFS